MFSKKNRLAHTVKMTVLKAGIVFDQEWDNAVAAICTQDLGNDMKFRAEMVNFVGQIRQTEEISSCKLIVIFTLKFQ